MSLNFQTIEKLLKLRASKIIARAELLALGISLVSDLIIGTINRIDWTWANSNYLGHRKGWGL